MAAIPPRFHVYEMSWNDLDKLDRLHRSRKIEGVMEPLPEVWTEIIYEFVIDDREPHQ